MDGGSSSKAPTKGEERHRQRRVQRPGPFPPRIEPFVPNTDHNPRDLKSWARRTGFNPNVSGEAPSEQLDPYASSVTPPPPPPPPLSPLALDLEKGLGYRRRAALGTGALAKGVEIRPDADQCPKEGLRRGDVGAAQAETVPKEELEVRKGGCSDEAGLRAKGDGLNGGTDAVAPPGMDPEVKKDADRREVEFDYLDSQEPEVPSELRPLGFRCGLTENPGWVPLILYGLQHYLSMAGSLVFIPLIMVPAMGGTDEETAIVISTMLLVSGITTLLHTFLGTRLPLVHGSSFVYLAPALVIINSEEFRNLSQNKFRHIMRELQGAIIIGSFFQTVLGYSGLMSLLLRLINPVVVAPTVAAVGLAFFSYGFPQAGTCIEISIPLIVLVLIFTLYMRRISLFGNRLFLVYAVPLSVGIIWVYASLLTAGGAYNYKGCSLNIPSSNILLDTCRRRANSMKYCRTDVSNAWRTSAWVRVPCPFQWGTPTFHFKTSMIMIIVSLVASVDSVGSYHSSSLLINLRPPTRGIVSRGIGLEGVCSILAGLWGIGTGSTTLTENIHTIDATKMASRKALQIGAAFLILFSFVGKIGALIASIPLALAASILCFTWGLIVALGLSTLRYTQTASSRNIIIVGFTLFISLSVPAYFQQYDPNSILVLPSYLLPYAVASNGPINTSSNQLNYALNAILSINIVVALFVAFVLDNTVPGSKQERGVYIWSDASRPDHNPASLEPYKLPEKIGCWFWWAKCIGP